ncbi:lysozyme family protein [Ohessyouella blattaphilus]|uniref:Lysozyme family protein n=1 Tax=Ohessyouella blattaphilus TaxID=2949333 RepID=A0ABT1EJM7_9FIRM|nr:lysozyme family protein [Ohessyouella blattaphilus]MCP1110895.1 lysozyme family protein [Ohessyouella blattaphilus]MCR8564289.1 lysozyme family protein [Ohessyouella blattaphilus]
MSKIKTRDVKKDIKSLNKSPQTINRMQSLYDKSRRYQKEFDTPTEQSSDEYATNHLSELGNDLASQGKQGAETLLRRASDHRQRVKSRKDAQTIDFQEYSKKGAKQRHAKDQFRRSKVKHGKLDSRFHNMGIGSESNHNKSPLSKAQKRRFKVVRKSTVKTSAHAAKTAYKTKQATQQAAKQSARAVKAAAKTVTEVAKKIAQVAYAGAKLAVAAIKSLVSLLIAGGWVSVIVILIICLFGSALYVFGDSSSNSYTPISAEVEAYTPIIRIYAKNHGIPDYTELIKAVMMQESGGKGNDPMQASESGFNTKYPRTPNGITDPEYSIDIGIQNLASCLSSAGVTNPVDMDHIRLALQGYNFGNGYISWAQKNHGGYSVANAAEFSDMMATKNGWTGYGDKQYVAHVLRYYPYGHINQGIGNTVITQVALSQLGNAGGQPFWSWYGFNGRVEWCACFVSWCADQGGYIESGIIPKFAGCVNGANWFKDRGQWQERSYTPSPGDIIFFDWQGDGVTDHVGIVEKCENGMVYTVEGNNNNSVRQATYSVGSGIIYGYGVPKY